MMRQTTLVGFYLVSKCLALLRANKGFFFLERKFIKFLRLMEFYIDLQVTVVRVGQLQNLNRQPKAVQTVNLNMKVLESRC